MTLEPRACRSSLRVSVQVFFDAQSRNMRDRRRCGQITFDEGALRMLARVVHDLNIDARADGQAQTQWRLGHAEFLNHRATSIFCLQPGASHAKPIILLEALSDHLPCVSNPGLREHILT